MPKLTLAPNVPVAFDVKYCDIVTGEYGPQLKFKGSAGGDAAVLYVDVAHAEPALRAAGALAGPLPPHDAVPAKGIAVRLARTNLVFTKAQAAGERTGTFTVAVRGGGSAPAATAASAAAGGAPASEAAERPKISQLYTESLDFVLEKVVPKLKAAGVPVTHEGTSAMASTVFIARKEGR